MIGHIEHGSDFGGLFRYLLADDKGARIIGGNAAGRTPFELTQEFNNCADQRRTTKKPVKHLIVSFAADDGYVSDEAKARIAKGAVEELGYTYNQYVVVDHHRDDPGHDWNHDHDHIHIAVNMITLDGKRVDDWQDKRKFEEILRQLEVDEKLTQIAPSKNRKFKAISHGQTQRVERELKEFLQGKRTLLPEIPLTTKLQAAIDKASSDKPDLTTFIGRLQSLNIDVKPMISDKGRKRISYRLSDLKVKGSKLHNASFPKLISQRGIDFNLGRDQPAMDAAFSGKQVNIPQEKHLKWSEIDLIDYFPTILKDEIRLIQSSLVKEIVTQQQLANLILHSNPIKVNTYLKKKELSIAVKSDCIVKVQSLKNSLKSPIFSGFLDNQEWKFESRIGQKSTQEILELVTEAIENTKNLNIEQFQKPQVQKSQRKKPSQLEL